jgi:Xaa-Pro aminopeptidase
LDVWLTFVRETSGGSDPALPLILDGGLTWLSALLVGANRIKIAVVGNYDADPLRSSGNWDEVVPYVEDIRPALLNALESCCGSDPRIGINFSESDDKADGITYGMLRVLQGLLDGTRFETCLVSAEGLVQDLRGIKSGTELARIRRAILETQAIFERIPEWALRGTTERELYDRIQSEMDRQGFGYSWDRAGDPIVNFGPYSMIGHGVPSESISLADGQVLHIDLGLIVEGYASDLQRCWFVGNEVPSDVTDALAAVNAAISAAADALKPGVAGWEVDAAARASIIASGYPEYMHAVGHQVGQVAHDGGGTLAPRWARYGTTPDRAVKAGQIYTLELGVTPPGRGYIGIEEMVVVTDTGVEWLHPRQWEMPKI